MREQERNCDGPRSKTRKHKAKATTEWMPKLARFAAGSSLNQLTAFSFLSANTRSPSADRRAHHVAFAGMITAMTILP